MMKALHASHHALRPEVDPRLNDSEGFSPGCPVYIIIQFTTNSVSLSVLIMRLLVTTRQGTSIASHMKDNTAKSRMRLMLLIHVHNIASHWCAHIFLETELKAISFLKHNEAVIMQTQ